MPGFNGIAFSPVAWGAPGTTSTPVDTSAPALSAASATATGSTAASGSVSTTKAGGTLYYLASASETATVEQVEAGSSKAVAVAGVQSVTFSSLPAASVLYPHYVHVDAAGKVSAVVNGASFTTKSNESTVGKATYVQEAFESRGGVPWTNLTGMRWYFFDQVWPAPLLAPVAQGSMETTDGNAIDLFDIAGLTTLLPGQVGTLAYTNTNGDPDQPDLISIFCPVYVH